MPIDKHEVRKDLGMGGEMLIGEEENAFSILSLRLPESSIQDRTLYAQREKQNPTLKFKEKTLILCKCHWRQR